MVGIWHLEWGDGEIANQLLLWNFPFRVRAKFGQSLGNVRAKFGQSLGKVWAKFGQCSGNVWADGEFCRKLYTNGFSVTDNLPHSLKNTTYIFLTDKF